MLRGSSSFPSIHRCAVLSHPLSSLQPERKFVEAENLTDRCAFPSAAVERLQITVHAHREID